MCWALPEEVDEVILTEDYIEKVDNYLSLMEGRKVSIIEERKRLTALRELLKIYGIESANSYLWKLSIKRQNGKYLRSLEAVKLKWVSNKHTKMLLKYKKLFEFTGIIFKYYKTF